MGGDYIILFVLIAAFVIFFIYRKGEKVDKTYLADESRQANSSAPAHQGYEFLLGIEEEKNRRQKELDASTKAITADLNARYGKDQAMKQRLSAFAKAEKLDRALTELWEQTQHYGSWSMRDDWQKWNRYNWEQIDCTESTEPNSRKKIESVKFVDHGTAYKLFRVMSPSFVDDGDIAELSLEEEGELVFGLKANYANEEYGPSYSIFDITAFKKQGNWASMLIRCQKIDQLESEKLRQQMKYHGAENIKDRFKE